MTSYTKGFDSVVSIFGHRYNPYRFAFNGKEKDDEIKGAGNSYDFGDRIYDPRIGRWMSRDPREAKYPQWSTYNAFVCNPILFVDPSGQGAEITREYNEQGKVTKIIVTTNIYVYSKTQDVNELGCYAGQIQSDIENQWNTPVNVDNQGNWEQSGSKNTVQYNKENVEVEFKVNVFVSKDENAANEQYNKGNIADNFIEIGDFLGSNFKGNTGALSTSDLDNRGTSTAAQEYGHLLDFLNLTNPADNDDTEHTDFNSKPFTIMTRPRVSQLGIKSNTPESEQAHGNALAKRHVTQYDISRINKGKVFSPGSVGYSLRTGKGSIGSRSETFKPTNQ